MLLCNHIADWSKESGKRVGAVIVGPWHEIRATGFNGLPHGLNDDVPLRHDRESGAKYLWSSHAERNAIFQAARIGVSISGCHMYSSCFPCVECAKAIIQSGLTVVIAPAPDLADIKWGSEFRISGEMFTEAGIEYRPYGASTPEDA